MLEAVKVALPVVLVQGGVGGLAGQPRGRGGAAGPLPRPAPGGSGGAGVLLGLPHQPVVGTGLLVDGGTSGPDLAQLLGVLLQLGVGAVELGHHRTLSAGDQGFEFGDPRRSVIVQRTTDISATDYGH